MRRDIGSELIVALLAAVALVIAAIFAVLLATSTRNPPQPTELPTAAFTESAVPPLGTTPEATAVAAVDTATPRVSFTESPTELIGITPSVAATSTHTQTATAAIEQTASETPSPPVNVTESIPTRTAALSATSAAVPSLTRTAAIGEATITETPQTGQATATVGATREAQGQLTETIASRFTTTGAASAISSVTDLPATVATVTPPATGRESSESASRPAPSDTASATLADGISPIASVATVALTPSETLAAVSDTAIPERALTSIAEATSSATRRPALDATRAADSGDVLTAEPISTRVPSASVTASATATPTPTITSPSEQDTPVLPTRDSATAIAPRNLRAVAMATDLAGTANTLDAIITASATEVGSVAATASATFGVMATAVPTEGITPIASVVIYTLQPSETRAPGTETKIPELTLTSTAGTTSSATRLTPVRATRTVDAGVVLTADPISTRVPSENVTASATATATPTLSLTPSPERDTPVLPTRGLSDGYHAEKSESGSDGYPSGAKTKRR